MRDRDDFDRRRAVTSPASAAGVRAYPAIRLLILPAASRHWRRSASDLRPYYRAALGYRHGRLSSSMASATTTRRARRQVHARRRARPVAAPPRGAHARILQAAVDVLERARPGLGTRYGGPAPRSSSLSGSPSSRRGQDRLSGCGRMARVPAPRLALIAQDHAERTARRLWHALSPHNASIDSRPRACVIRSIAALARLRLPASSTASTTTPRSRASACSTSCST